MRRNSIEDNSPSKAVLKGKNFSTKFASELLKPTNSISSAGLVIVKPQQATSLLPTRVFVDVVQEDIFAEDQQQKSDVGKFRKAFGGNIKMMLAGKKAKTAMAPVQAPKDIPGDDEGKLNSLFFTLSKLDQEGRYRKAVRHFRDSLSLQPIRHDIELCSWFLIPSIYKWQTSPGWTTIMVIVGLIYPLLSLYEPANMYVKDYFDNSQLQKFEGMLLGFVWIDILLEISHRSSDKDRKFLEHYILNGRLSTLVLIATALLIDYLNFHSNFPNLTYRFSRYLRPFLVFYYSIELRRTIISILQSLKQITQFLVFICIFTSIFGIVTWRFISDLDSPVQTNLTSDFSNIIRAISQFYIMISFDNYPSAILPSFSVSGLYSMIFIIYCIMVILVLIPIPVSVVYQAFKLYRSKLVLLDRVLQRQALFACFVTLDFNNQKQIDFPRFEEFMSRVYLKRKRYIKRIRGLFQHLDSNDCQVLSMNEFFETIEVFEKFQKFQAPSFREWSDWQKFRKFMNTGKQSFKRLYRWWVFEAVMMVLLIMNCTLLIIGTISDDPTLQDWVDTTDSIFFWFYFGEFLIKIIGNGIDKYFEDSWNVLDFWMIAMSVAYFLLQQTFDFLKNAKSAKATKLLKLIKINRMFRVFKALKNFRIFQVFSEGFELFYQVKLLFQKILMCFPIVIRLIPVNLMLFYLYSFIALENYNTDTFPYEIGSPYEQTYANFTSFQNSMLIFFQVSLNANWSTYIYDVEYKFGNYILPNVIFLTFDFFSQFILFSLVRGIVWEVFTVVDSEIRHQEKVLQQEEDELPPHMRSPKLRPLNGTAISFFEAGTTPSTPSSQPDIRGIIKYMKFLNNLQNSGLADLAGEEEWDKQSTQIPQKFAIYSISEHSNKDEGKSLFSQNESIPSDEDLNHIIDKTKTTRTNTDKQLKNAINASPQLKQISSHQKIDQIVPNLNNEISPATQASEKLQNILLKSSMKSSFFGITKKSNKIHPQGSEVPLQSQQPDSASDDQLSHTTNLLEEQNQLITNAINQGNNRGSIAKDKQDLTVNQLKGVSQPNLLIVGLLDQDDELLQSQLNKLSRASVLQDTGKNSAKTSLLLQLRESDPSIQTPKDYMKMINDKAQGNKDRVLSEQIFNLRKLIKPLSFLKRQQAIQRRAKGRQSGLNSVDFTVEYLDSDDEDSIGAFERQINNYIHEDDENAKRQNQRALQKDQNSSLSFQYVMKRALLKDSNMDIVKKYEIDYFHQTYGSFFEQLNEVNITPILRFESFLISNFQRILRHKNISSQLFFHVLQGMESNISNVILRKGSVVKFVFQDSFSNWVCLKEEEGKTYPCMLGQGPWSFHEEVFTQKTSGVQKEEIYVAKDFFVQSPNQTMQNLNTQFYKQLVICAKCLENKHAFTGLDPDYSVLQELFKQVVSCHKEG